MRSFILFLAFYFFQLLEAHKELFENSNVISLTPENFETVTLNKKCIFMIWVDWCGHCKKFAPLFGELSNELKDEAFFGQINGEDQKEVALRFEIGGYPTIIVYENRKYYKYEGRRTKEAITEFLKDGYKIIESFDISDNVSFWQLHQSKVKPILY